MPTYNGATYLPAALDSVAKQAGKDVELVAVDDGSTDETIAILRSFSGKLRMKILECPHGGNWVANTNEGLRSSTGTYACFLHQDDIWATNRVAVLRTWTARFPEAVAILHPVFFIDSSGRPLGRWLCPLPPARLLPAELLIERLLVQNFVAIPAPLFRREALSRLGGLDEDLWYTADWDFWLKLAAAGPIAVCPNLLASFRVHPGSLTSRRTADLAEMRRQLEVVLRRHLPLWKARHAHGCDVERVARFSIEVNLALASWARGRPFGRGRLVLGFARLGPLGWHRYFRDSRIVERVLARLRLLGAR